MTDPFRAAGLLARHEIVMTGSVDPEDHLGAILGATGADGARIAAAIEPAHLGFVVVPAPGLSATLSSGSIFDAASSGVDVVFETSRSASEACEPRDGIASSDVGGIRIVARRTEGSGAVAVTGLVAAGALAESPAASGTSKLLSVLMARSLDGAVNSSPALDPAFVRTGSVYAADHVGVFVEAPPEALVAAVLAVRSALLAPAMDVDSFESARQLCIAESGMAPPIEVQALRDAYGSILALGSSLDPEGSVSTLGGLTRQSVMQFHSAALKRGAVISVAGEVDPLKGCHACSVAVLAPLAPDAQPATLASPSPVVPVPAGTTVVQGPGSDAVIVIAYPVEGISHESRWAIEALAKLLDGPSGILTREIVVERALAQKCSASYWGTEQFGIVTLTVRAPATNVLAVVNILPVVVGEAIGEPPTDEQMQAVRAALLSVRAHDLALPGPASKTLALEVLLAGGAVDLEADEKSMAGLEAENVTDVLEAFFDNLNPIIVALAP
jgi:predicted Zn-dependent peptidase